MDGDEFDYDTGSELVYNEADDVKKALGRYLRPFLSRMGPHIKRGDKAGDVELVMEDNFDNTGIDMGPMRYLLLLTATHLESHTGSNRHNWKCENQLRHFKTDISAAEMWTLTKACQLLGVPAKTAKPDG